MSPDDNLPVIRLGDVKQAEFTVNRYTTKGGEVKEQEVDVDLGDETLEEIESSVEEGIDDALSRFKRTGEPPEGAKPAISGPTVDDDELQDIMADVESQEPPGPGTFGESDDQDVTEAAESDEESSEQDTSQPSDGRDALDVGREIVNEQDITSSDWNDFQAAMRDSGITDQSKIGDIWQELKDEGVIQPGEAESEADGGSGAGQEEDQDAGQDTGDSGRGQTEESVGPAEATPGPDITDLTDAPPEDVEAAYLVVEGGSDTGEAAKDQFEPFIDAGVIQVADIYGSPAAQDVKRSVEGELETPTVAIEMDDGSYDVLTLETEATEGEGGGDAEGEQPELGIPPGTDILLTSGMSDAFLTLAERLSEPIEQGDIQTVNVNDGIGEAIVEQLPPDAETPLYAHATEEGIEIRELETLVEKYT